MANNTKSILVLSTFPETASVKSVAETLVNEKLAACVNVIPGVQSIFRWQDKIDNANENILIIKTKDSLYDELEVRIKELHQYELPEIISVPIDKGLNKYLDWISESTK